MIDILIDIIREKGGSSERRAQQLLFVAYGRTVLGKTAWGRIFEC